MIRDLDTIDAFRAAMHEAGTPSPAVIAQAAALKDAAKSGAPFCEE